MSVDMKKKSWRALAHTFGSSLWNKSKRSLSRQTIDNFRPSIEMPESKSVAPQHCVYYLRHDVLGLNIGQRPIVIGNRGPSS